METFETKRQWKAIADYPSLFFLFIAGSVLGFIVEGIWWIFKVGYWESHSALVWGPFCIIYGVGAVAVYLFSNWLREKKLIWQFVAFSLSGAVVEYFSSLLQEVCFGSTSWNYSHHILNIGGRVSFQMALVWGIFGVVFAKFIYPYLSRILDKLRGKKAKVICIVLSIFMVIDILVSCAAVFRWRERQNDEEASNPIEVILDAYYDDDTMRRLYPNMKFRE